MYQTQGFILARSLTRNKQRVLSFLRTSSSSPEYQSHDGKRREKSKHESQIIYLHIAPCGDFWTGDEVFAAKHLQPDYVKSIPIPSNISVELLSKLETVEDDFDNILKDVYDSGDISILIEYIMPQNESGLDDDTK